MLTQSELNQDLVKLLLPPEIFDYFEITNLIIKERFVAVFLDERDVKPIGYSGEKLTSKGFHPESIIQDFPIRDKAVFLHEDGPPSEELMLKLIHELEVHQIELELQNAELEIAKSAAQKAVEKYTELYDFAPSGYFTLSTGGKIINLNLCGSQMLGKVRSKLINSNLGFFVSDDTRTLFNYFLKAVFLTKAKETCEVTLLTPGAPPMKLFLYENHDRPVQ